MRVSCSGVSPHDRNQTGTERALVRNVYTEYCKQHVHIILTNLVAAKWGDNWQCADENLYSYKWE